MQVSLHWGEPNLHPIGAAMPAISADTVALPRIPTVDPTA
jgi:hypothetical protein